eukprot:CAMPEP_0195506756 /NCGR_PEP_ID=MMETSP0794_2-20130614/325_1 /TAXON_ID=515487 /ORGANISM="Stephanopyxis turris, Strain CCMP 815" /LENGTH=227 /DNA_ID=CAMNT_0040633181 /DNA_START=138 /DNA_END=821 /DNA_ORIENTATION=+
MSSEEESGSEEEVYDEEEGSGEEEVSEEEEEEEEEEEVVVAPVPAKRSRGKGKGKKGKDPNKPKRNMSSFFLYSNANRARIKSENPDATFGEIAKLVSEEFKAISDKERKKWDTKAAKDKKRYDEEMRHYVPPEESSDEEGPKKKKKKKAKDPNKPKRNMSSFFLYSNANRAQFKLQNPDATFGELAKIISENFKAISDKERKKWDKKAAKDKIRYQQEMEVYNANN